VEGIDPEDGSVFHKQVAASAAAATDAPSSLGKRKRASSVSAAAPPAAQPAAPPAAPPPPEAVAGMLALGEAEEAGGDGRLGVIRSELARAAVRQPLRGGHRCRSCGNVFGKTRRAARGKTAKKGGKKAVRKGSFRKGRKHSKKQRR
jgi:hypothetical protein